MPTTARSVIPGRPRKGHEMTYMGHAYYPWWLVDLADGATSEGAAPKVVVHGADQDAATARTREVSR
jgi:hypothetical protein